MNKHLYNSSATKVKWFVRRFGWKELILKPWRVAMAPIIIPFLPKRSFSFDGRPLSLFYHRYNMTWAGERCAEIPIALSYAAGVPSGDFLEIGNVLSHYGLEQHLVVDKYEKGPGVQSVDIVDFKATKKFSLVLSISTFEHIGFDDSNDGRSGEKIQHAISCCRRLLTPNGLLVLTVPIGYNPDLDGMLRSRSIDASRARFLIRTAFSAWREASEREAMEAQYGCPYPYGNAVAVLEFGAGTSV